MNVPPDVEWKLESDYENAFVDFTSSVTQGMGSCDILVCPYLRIGVPTGVPLYLFRPPLEGSQSGG